jgi:hypothetical protein
MARPLTNTDYRLLLDFRSGLRSFEHRSPLDMRCRRQEGPRSAPLPARARRPQTTNRGRHHCRTGCNVNACAKARGTRGFQSSAYDTRTCRMVLSDRPFARRPGTMFCTATMRLDRRICLGRLDAASRAFASSSGHDVTMATRPRVRTVRAPGNAMTPAVSCCWRSSSSALSTTGSRCGASTDAASVDVRPPTTRTLCALSPWNR